MRKLSIAPSLSNTADAFFCLFAAKVCCVVDEAGLGVGGVNTSGDVEDVVVDGGGPRRSVRLRASSGQSAGRLIIWPLAAIQATLFQHGVVAPADYSHQEMFGFMLESLPDVDPTVLPAGFAFAECSATPPPKERRKRQAKRKNLETAASPSPPQVPS